MCEGLCHFLMAPHTLTLIISISHRSTPWRSHTAKATELVCGPRDLIWVGPSTRAVPVLLPHTTFSEKQELGWGEATASSGFVEEGRGSDRQHAHGEGPSHGGMHDGGAEQQREGATLT